jgi:hypothetical protein
MYYRKYFEGTVHAWTDGDLPNWKFRVRGDKTADSERDLQFDSEFRSINQYRSNIIGNALASTLRDCGFDAVYSKGYLYLDYSNSDVGIYVYYMAYSTGGGFITALPGQDNVDENDIVVGSYNSNTQWYSSNPAGYGIFKNGRNDESAYRCAITVKGETTGFVRISISSFNNLINEDISGNVLYISRFVDTRNNKNVWGLHRGSGSNSNYEFGSSNYPGQICPIYEDNLLPVYWSKRASGSLNIYYPDGEILPYITTAYNDKLLTQEHRSGTIYTLIDIFLNSHSPFIKGKNIFIKIGDLTSKQFYDFDGDIYYIENCACTKCVTQVVPTPADIDDGYIEETNNG